MIHLPEHVLLTPTRGVSPVNILGTILNFVIKDENMSNILLWPSPASTEN